MNSTFNSTFSDLTVMKGDKGDKGDKGERGADGKSAYQYAQDGGYTGTEAEFAVKMAEEMPDWAKAETKPTYTAAEVGAVPESAKIDIDKNTSARHTHSNKSALDSISESDIAKWNSGTAGTAGTVEITGATGLAAGSAPTVTEAADSTAQARKYQLGIPAGKDGADGQNGADGVTPNIQIGTVETLPTGSPATASMTGTLENPLLNLGIPKGTDGTSGSGSSDFELIGTVTSDGAGDSVGIYIAIDFTKYKEVFITANMAANVIQRIILGKTLAWYDGTVICANGINGSEITNCGTPSASAVLAQSCILNMLGTLLPFSGWQTGYGNGVKGMQPVANPRSTLLATNFAYIRMDSNNHGAVPEGAKLTVWGLK